MKYNPSINDDAYKKGYIDGQLAKVNEAIGNIQVGCESTETRPTYTKPNIEPNIEPNDVELIAAWLETLHCDNWKIIGCSKTNCQLFRLLAKDIREGIWK